MPMSEHDGEQPALPLPTPTIEKANRWLPSLVWLIPLLAALIGIGLVARSVLDKGPTVTVSFHTGDGLEPVKTNVKYKDVYIGQVRAVKIDPDLTKVLVTIDLTKEAKRFTSADTRFWVVRPRIGASGVSGLGTLLSGAYIGVDAGKSKEEASDFVGLEQVPQIIGDQKGTQFVLHGESLGSIDTGTPLFYRRIPAGQVVNFSLDPSGSGVTVTVFVNAPYDQFVGKDTRWWHASGVDVRLDSAGFKLNTQSLAALLVGGVAFEAIDGQKPPAASASNSIRSRRTSACRSRWTCTRVASARASRKRWSTKTIATPGRWYCNGWLARACARSCAPATC